MTEHSTKLVSEPVDYICVYTRVSTRKQSIDQKHGLCYQKDLCKSYIDKFYSLMRDESYWEDIGSSYKSERILTEMGEMMRKLKPNTLILVSEVSRLGRNYKMVEGLLRTIEKNKSYVVSVSENLVYGMNKIKNKEFIHKVIDSEKESDVLSMRVKSTHSYIRKNGGHVGKAPFGYKITKNVKNIPILKENPEDFRIIDLVVNLSDDCYSYDEIASIMNTQNLFYKNKVWTSSKIKEILKKFYPEHMSIETSRQFETKINVVETGEYVTNNDVKNLLTNTKLKELNKKEKNPIIKRQPKMFMTNDSNGSNSSNDSNYSASSNDEHIKLRSGRIVVKH
jgi:DNA invertase Pin-like site-specific DNA recombinase